MNWLQHIKSETLMFTNIELNIYTTLGQPVNCNSCQLIVTYKLYGRQNWGELYGCCDVMQSLQKKEGLEISECEKMS